jgi:hypothetical protein
MPALGAGIHERHGKADVDGRDKAGHDEFGADRCVNPTAR